jgi:hypothetical protein
MQANEESDESHWAKLCDRYDAAVRESQAAMQAVRDKMDAGGTPSIEELVRLENATALRNNIERQMHDFATTRPD